jgi:hypothetical protein
MTQTSDLISTELVKIKIQGKYPNIEEFKKRLKPFLAEMDCMLLNESGNKRNRDSNFFRNYVDIGLNRRKDNGKEEKR